jgi:EmrB/QacA subfamily drug resistance transporter
MTMQRKWQVLLIVAAGVFMAGLDVFIVNIAFPQIHHDYPGTSLSSLSWILNSYTIVFAAFLIAAGRWSDNFGRKRSFLLGTALFTMSSAACAVSPSIGFLIGARAFQGFGAALLMPASLGLLLPEFPPGRRHVAIGAWAAIGGIAAAAGPPLGGLLVAASWRWVFLVNVPFGLLSLIIGTRVLREIRHPETIRPDFLGAGLLTMGVASLVAAIVKGPDWGWGSASTIAAFAFTVLIVLIVALRILHHPSPIVEPALLRVRAFSLATLASMIFFAGFAAMLLACVLFLTSIWHQQVLTAGLEIFPGPAMAATWAIPGARLGNRFGAARVGAIGSLLFSLGGIWWLWRLGGAQHYAMDFLPGMLIGGVGVGFVIPSLTGAVAATLSPERLATGTAVLTTGRQIGSALGAATLIAVIGTPHSAQDFSGAWKLILASSVIAAAALTMIGRPAPALAERPTVDHRQTVGAAL